MATANQTARDKFLEARKAGVDAVTARKQSYGDVLPAQSGGVVQAQPIAPVAGVPPAPPVTTPTAITPAPTPTTPTEPVTPQVTGVEGQKFTQAPVDPTTGLSKPIEPTTPVTPTTVPEVDKTAEIKAQTESKLVENQQKAQLEETKRQAIAKETAQANVPTSQQDILNTLVSGAGVQPQKTQAYRAAQFMYSKYSKFNAMTPTQLESSLKQGQIGTEMDKLLSQNPNYIQAKQKFDNTNRIESLNSTMSGIVSGVTGTTTEPVDEMQALGDKIIKSLNLTDETYADAYTKYVAQNPQVVEYTQQLSNINRDIADTTTRLNEGYKQMKKDYPSMSPSALITLMGSRFQGANDTLTNLNNTKTYLQADLTNALEMGKAQYDAVSKDIDNAMSQRNSVISQIVQSQFSLAGKQAEMNLEAENAKRIADEALNDPATAISNVMATYAEMGIPFTESIQTKVANAEEFIANGGTLAGYIDKMIKDVQNKPLYKSMVDAQMRSLAPQQESTNFSFANIGDGRIAVQNPRTGEVSFASAGSVSSSNAPTSASAKYLDIPTGTDVGVQCGQFARTLCGMDATPGGNSLDARKKAYIDTAPVAGGMVLFTGSGYDKTYGHIAAIESVNPDGTVNIVESNLKNDNRVTRRTISANDPAIHGFYNDTPLAKSTGTTSTQVRQDFTDSDIAVLSSVKKLDKQGKETLKDNGFTERDWANFDAGLLPPTSAQKEESQSVINKIDNILESDWKNAVGTWKGLPVAGTDRTVVEKKVNALIDSLAATNLDKLKGPMSDKDIVFLKNIATYLSTDLSEEEFLATINDIKTRYSKIVQGTPSANLSQPTTQSQPTQTNTGAGQTYQSSTGKNYSF